MGLVQMDCAKPTQWENHTMRQASLPIVLLSLLCLAAHADTFTWSGDTSNRPTWNRPVEGFGSLSGVGTDVPYDVFTFSVSITGAYDIEMLSSGDEDDPGPNPGVSPSPTPSSAPSWDGYFLLYQNSFDPNDQLTNGVASDDDGPSSLLPLIAGVNLQAGTPYFLITTGFGNEDFGPYTNQIRGDGTVNDIPEPGTLALVGLGLLGLVIRRRLRKA